jgi:hypothetical protein
MHIFGGPPSIFLETRRKYRFNESEVRLRDFAKSCKWPNALWTKVSNGARLGVGGL